MQRQQQSLLDVISQDGVFLALHVGYWRGTAELRREELGLSKTVDNTELLSLGRKYLVPKQIMRRFGQLEKQARAALNRRTWPFFGGTCRYAPNRSLPEILRELDAFKAEFNDEAERLITAWPALRAEAMEQWGAQARKMSDELDIDSAQLIAAVNGKLPLTTDKMRRRFFYNYDVFSVAFPDGTVPQAVQGQAVIEARARAVNDAKGYIRESANNFVSECVQTLRQETVQLCDEVLHSTHARGRVHGKTVSRLVKFLDRFRMMNFANDTEMAQVLESAITELSAFAPGANRKGKQAFNSFNEGVAALRRHAIALAERDPSEVVTSFAEGEHRPLNLD